MIIFKIYFIKKELKRITFKFCLTHIKKKFNIFCSVLIVHAILLLRAFLIKKKKFIRENEVLIFEGENNNECYSYHIEKKIILIDLFLLNSWPLVASSQIGELSDNLEGVRRVIGGMNNDLLFIIYYPKKNIQVIDLKTMKPLVEINKNMISQMKKTILRLYVTALFPPPLTMNSTKKVINNFLLFHRNIGLLINIWRLKESIENLKLSRPYVITKEMEEKEVEQWIDTKVEPPKE
ncbi:hypothetical protein RFI_35746 [Reticulomyxa filosa]|uniref:Uncharacterized protein n=1 Tax=Reticulomyxa filosa TaxID=46433 RepID=X6LJ91_RETFI|nr:hypothetical protein RFI_35746 [Reticulomyxa filosa]|eukprot:ETO01694.1 hypothetical protein RFI_35746 [Reticulomyxa filosa]